MLFRSDIDRLVEVLQVAPKAAVCDFVNSESYILGEMCCWFEGETLEKYILAIIEYCSDVESRFWDINEWKWLMFALYKTGCYTDDWYEGPIDMPSLKNAEKAAAFAEKHGLDLDNDGGAADEN